MKTAYTFDEAGYHTWKDFGGLLGLTLDGVFCTFVVIAALLMVALATIVLGLDNLVSPAFRLLGGAEATGTNRQG